MKIDSRSSSLIIGMALFAMFFGSGNLIYPLYIGKIAQGGWLSAAVGFLLTAVLLPFLGVIAMVIYKGSYDNFFKTIGHKKGFALSVILLTVWIPLGSAPRCMTLAFASFDSYFSQTPPLWLFSLLYSFLVYFVISREVGFLDILGKYITPLLLGCILIICYQGFAASPPSPTMPQIDSPLILQGLMEGYNTMDLIASFFFSASVIHILTQSGTQLNRSLSLVFKSSIIGITILGGVYLMLISISAFYSNSLEGVAKDQLLSILAQTLLGSTWSFVAILAIFLACFSTSIALIVAYTDFLHEEIFKQTQHPKLSIILAIAVTYVMSLFGLDGIAAVTAPVLKVCYPILLTLIIFNIGRFVIRNKGLAAS